MDLGLLYQALKQNQVDMVAGSATDGLIAAHGLDHASRRQELLSSLRSRARGAQRDAMAIPELRATLDELSGRISTVAMRNMNYQVDGQHRSVRDVAKDFLDGSLK